MLRQLLNSLFRSPAAASELPASVANPAVAALLGRAQTCRVDGRAAEAIALCRQALAIEPSNTAARHILVRAQMPGEIYHQVLRRIHEHLQPSTYVEIGVAKGNTITLACPETIAIGIDPEPRIESPLTARTRIFAETSDDFFARHDLRDELGGLPVELAFIDGLHHFEFALRDFINLESYSAPDSTILVHDCCPLDAVTAARVRVCDFWSGDVWKLVLCLKKYRPELSIHTIESAPTGLAMIRNLDPASTVLRTRLQEISDEFISMPFAAIEDRKSELLNLFSNEWEKVRALLSAP
jgi:hypothetical protein